MRSASKTGWLASALLVSWGLFVLAAFLFGRDELKATARSLSDILSYLALLLLFLLIAGSLGKIIIRLIAGNDSGELRERVPLISIALGLGALSLIMFVLGVLGLFYPATAYSILLAGGLLGLKEARGLWQSLRATLGRGRLELSFFEALLLLTLAMALLMGFLGALAPPFLGDDMVYHLVAPKAYLANHRIIEIPRNIYTYFPMGTEMLYVLAMLLKNDVLAKLIHYLFGVLIVISIYRYAGQVGLPRRHGLMAAAIFYTVPTVWYISAWSAYIDLALAFFLTTALFAYIESYRSPRRIWPVVSGLSLGFALGTKFTALYMVPVFLLGLAIREAARPGERSAGATLKNILLPVILCLLVPSPWYIKNIYYTGNPFFPFFLDIIPTREVAGWDAERARNYLAMLGRYGGPEKSVGDYLLLPWNLTVNAKFVAPRFFDGIIGPVFLMVLPAFFLLRGRLAKEIKIIVCFGALYFAFWAFSSQQARFLVPLLPPLSLAAAWSVENLTSARRAEPAAPARLRRCLLSLVVLALLANLLTIAYYFSSYNPLSYVAGLESRRDYLAKRLDYYELYEFINKNLPRESKIFLVDTGNFTYYLERDYYADFIFEDHTLGRIVNQARAPEEVRQRFKELGMTHLLYCHPILLNRDFMPFSDEQSLLRFRRFLESYGRLIKNDEVFHLWEVQ